MPKPVSLAALASTLQDYYSTRDAQMVESDKLYHADYTGVVDADYAIPLYKSGTPARIVDLYRNQIRTDSPTVTVRAVGPSREAQSSASLMTLWGYAMLKGERLHGSTDVGLECAFFGLLRGALCKKILIDVEKLPPVPEGRPGSRAWREYESALMAYWPFMSRALDPMTVYPAPNASTPLPYVLERQARRALDMWTDYPDWSDPKTSALAPDQRTNPAREVEWLEYWSAPMIRNGEVVEQGWYIVEADGERVLEKENPYGFVPYIWEYSGLGHGSYDGDPAHSYANILTPIAGDLVEEVRLMTALSAGTQMAVFPTLLTTEDARSMAQKMGVGPARIIQHQPGQEPKFMEPPPPNPNIFLLLDRVRANINRVYSTALEGGRPQGVEYGVLQAQLIGQSLTAIKPVRDALDRVGSLTLQFMAREAKSLGLSMLVDGGMEKSGKKERARRVEPEDFKHLDFEVAYELVDASVNDRLLLTGEALRRAGDISQRTFWTQFAKHIVQDADEEEALLWAERLLQQMFASGALAQLVMSETQAQVAEESVQGQVEGAKELLGGVGGRPPGERERGLEGMAGVSGMMMAGTEAGQGVVQEVRR